MRGQIQTKVRIDSPWSFPKGESRELSPSGPCTPDVRGASLELSMVSER